MSIYNFGGPHPFGAQTVADHMQGANSIPGLRYIVKVERDGKVLVQIPHISMPLILNPGDWMAVDCGPAVPSPDGRDVPYRVTATVTRVEKP